MRISDWSSDVGSADLNRQDARAALRKPFAHLERVEVVAEPLHIAQATALRQHDAERRARDSRHQVRERVRRIEPVDPDEDGAARGARRLQPRSEEHTSELQSLMRISYAVFCLKKKTKTTHRTKNKS